MSFFFLAHPVDPCGTSVVIETLFDCMSSYSTYYNLCVK